MIQGQFWSVPGESDVNLVLCQSSYLYYHFINRVTLHIPDSHRLHPLRPPQVGDHDLHQPRQVDVVPPAPLRPGQRVIEHHGPGVGDVLSRVGAVLDLEVRDPLLNLSYQRAVSLLQHEWNVNVHLLVYYFKVKDD